MSERMNDKIEFTQEDLLFLWDAASILLHERCKEIPYPVNHQGMYLWMLIEGRQGAIRKAASIAKMASVVRRLGEMVKIPEYQEQIKKEAKAGERAIGTMMQLLGFHEEN